MMLDGVPVAILKNTLVPFISSDTDQSKWVSPAENMFVSSLDVDAD